MKSYENKKLQKNKFKWIVFGLINLIFLSLNTFANVNAGDKQGETMIATGEFEVKLSSQAEDKINVGRMLIDKIYHGGLNGTGQGQMLSKRTTVEGSAGYVAIEEFNGSVQGKKGSLTLQHTGVMNRGTPSLEVMVIPDSGTGELTGISGTMQINISKDKHEYVFEYSIEQEK